ncbi:MAG: carboxylating nicotinate-nucleotide diphosphorylase [Myxococcales bacterium]|nr:carboxylating nicotinate-nucleotide diphosphorylase [Myxococcota bacterium]MDW8281172.1 carboxylating nicotinate-nucleotide diphosphorylase [Myxococcales bacterium]
MASLPSSLPHALPPSVLRLIELALEEDLGRGDVTSEAIFGEEEMARAVVQARADLVLSGLDVACAVIRRVAPSAQLEPHFSDGDSVPAGAEVVTVFGPVRALLGAERTALNFLQRLSGVATLTRAFVAAVRGTGARIVDTRKTVPGFRFLDKRAVRHGGGSNHRADLGSGLLLKDNHIAAAGGVAAAVRRARQAAPHTLRLEVEVTTPAELAEALAEGVDVVLLDNMSPAQVAAAVATLPPRGDPRRPLVEVSGGVTLATVRAYAEAGADLISVGALTHSAPAADLSMEIAGP